MMLARSSDYFTAYLLNFFGELCSALVSYVLPDKQQNFGENRTRELVSGVRYAILCSLYCGNVACINF